ncbi:hypothetical protein FJY90_05125 [Candidatus Gottesmanbacteria bacterium]|nr:hypothetical protein [Candidatus Gottesmanbacteria bacterium]
MLKREISKERFQNIGSLRQLKNPEETINSFRGRKLKRRKFGHKILEVVTITEGDIIIVITQYYLGEVNES